MKKVCVLGSGSWGTALAMLLASNDSAVTLWGRCERLVNEINQKHVNVTYLPKLPISDKIVATTDLEIALKDAELVLFAVPSEATRDLAQRVAEIGLSKNARILSTAKGIEKLTGKRMTELIGDSLAGYSIAVISGPTHAEEVARQMASAAVIGCKDEAVAKELQETFTTPWFRTYTSLDVEGIEYGGAVKNVFAIAGGLAEGLGLGDNAKAALVSRGLAELIRLGTALGGDAETFQGLSGVGDLIVTCYSGHSRNNRVGQMLGKGYSIEDIGNSVHMVAEGIPNAASVYEIARKAGVDTPIIDAVYSILYRGKSPSDLLEELLRRDLRPETDC